MKIVASIDEIRAEMQRRIGASKWANSYCAECEAPFPYRTIHDGVANWTANVAVSVKRGCEGFLLDIVAELRRDYDLPAQPQTDAIASPVANRKPPF